MESHIINIDDKKPEVKKVIDAEKIENFLKKVQIKLDMGVEDIGKSNENILTNWMNQIKAESKSGKIIVDYDKKLFQENINRDDCLIFAEGEGEGGSDIIPHDSINKFHQKFEKLYNSDTSLIEKQEIIEYFTQNSDNFNFTEKESEEIEIYLLGILNESCEWEILNAGIIIITIFLQKKILNVSRINLISAIKLNFFKLIQHHEYRLRTNLPKLMKEICEIRYHDNYLEGCVKYFLENLVSDILKNFNLDSSENDMSNVKNINLNKTSLTSTGTPTIDTSKNTLIEIIQSLQNSQNFINFDFEQEIFENFLLYLDHHNKGVRITSFEILEKLIQFYTNPIRLTSKINTYLNTTFKEKVITKISTTLIDFYPQVRFAALNFLLVFNRYISAHLILIDDKNFRKEILPLICLNRYLPVEGVKNISLSLWKELVNVNGIKIIKEDYDYFCLCYLKEMASKSHLSREAACRCLQELIMKVYDENLHLDLMTKNADLIIYVIGKCIKDACWNVREAALNVSGYIFVNLEKRGENINFNCDKLNSLLELIRLHLFDNILEVRDSAAFAVRIVLSGVNQDDIINIDKRNGFLSYIKSLISELNAENLITLEKNYQNLKNSIFEKIKKRTELIIHTQQDSHDHNNCTHEDDLTNSIIPDLGFIRELDSWEYIDAIFHLIKEISEASEDVIIYKKLQLDFYKTLSSVIDYFCRNYNTLQNLFKKGIWSCLISMFKKMKKSDIEFYIDEVKDIIVKELSNNSNNLCGFECENFIKSLTDVTSKKYVKSKFKASYSENKALLIRIDTLLC